jgi:hypothetical protein
LAISHHVMFCLFLTVQIKSYTLCSFTSSFHSAECFRDLSTLLILLFLSNILVHKFAVCLGLGFELRAWHLQSRCPPPWATPPVHFALVIWKWVLNCSPPNLSFPSSWDYRWEPLVLSEFLVIVQFCLLVVCGRFLLLRFYHIVFCIKWLYYVDFIFFYFFNVYFLPSSFCTCFRKGSLSLFTQLIHFKKCWAGRVAQVVEGMPSKRETLSSNCSIK